MNNMKYTGWLLESVKDLEDYREMSDTRFMKGINSVIQSHVPIERWNNVANKNEFSSIFRFAIAEAHAKGESVLKELANIYDVKMLNMFNSILDGKKLIVNSLGGYCFLTHDDYEIIDSYSKKMTYKIDNGTKFINLENDPTLEDFTINHLSKLDKNFSYILEASSLSKDELFDILIKFKNAGGIGIWQYTTASNIEQLYMFIDIGIEIGLKQFMIYFNAGNNMDIKELIAKYEINENIDFKYSFEVI